MKIAILAGETSGDNYGGLLAESIKKFSPGTFIMGTGGEKMKETCNLFIEIPCGKMGFSDVIINIRRFYLAYKKVLKAIDEEKPALVVFIDNPGFNLKVARRIGKRYSCLYYIPPKIWAHHYSRVNIIRKYIKLVVPVFPFEKELYEKENVECRWFGHPAADLIKHPGKTRPAKAGGEDELPVIGLLPGSREEEVMYLLPVFLKLAKNMEKERSLQFIISASDNKIKKIEEGLLEKHGLSYAIISGNPYRIINRASLLFAASGTINMEAALAEKPLMVFYKTSPLNYILARMVVQLKHISPVNLMLGKTAVPEFIQFFPAGKIKKTAFELLDGGKLYHDQISGFRLLRQSTGAGEISDRVARLVLSCGEK